MAASYSSFLTTQYYSPVFNTALFDGPFRIYFSQSYEAVALKIYHLLQTQNFDLWTQYKQWSEESQQHVFVLIYPSDQDVALAFDGDHQVKKPELKKWEEGFIFGMSNPHEDEKFVEIINVLIEELKKNMRQHEVEIRANRS